MRRRHYAILLVALVAGPTLALTVAVIAAINAPLGAAAPVSYELGHESDSWRQVQSRFEGKLPGSPQTSSMLRRASAFGYTRDESQIRFGRASRVVNGTTWDVIRSMNVSIELAGWPARCLYGVRWHSASFAGAGPIPRSGEDRFWTLGAAIPASVQSLFGLDASASYMQAPIPWHIRVKGAVFNSIWYSSLVVAPLLAPTAMRMFQRRRRGQCSECGYLLPQGGRCPECGQAASIAARSGPA